MKKVILNSDPALRWENQAKQYPDHGDGIVYFKGTIENEIWVDCLLYYGDDNLLEGVLNHYPFELFPLPLTKYILSSLGANTIPPISIPLSPL